MKYFVLFLILLAANGQTVRAEGPEKWFYAYVDLLHETHGPKDSVGFGTQEFVDLLTRLHASGYRVVVLSNYYLASIGHLNGSHPNSTTYLKNLKRIKDEAARFDIEIIPEVMSVGSSGQLLLNDPHLAEGKLAKDCEFVVQTRDGGQVADLKHPESVVTGGGFEGSSQDVVENFGLNKNEFEFSDDASGNGSQSILVKDATAGIFVIQKHLPLKKNHQYTWSFKIKTENLTGNDDLHLYSIVSGKDAKFGVRKLHHVGHDPDKAKGKWHTYVVSLNSFDYDRAEISIGFDGVTGGKVWIDDVSLKQARMVNVLLRDDLPLVVKNDNGVELEKDIHYEINLADDFGLEGFYLPTDEADAIVIKPAAGLSNNDELRVSYYHAQLPNAESHRVCCSLTNPRLLHFHREQVRLLNQLLAPKRWFVNHDEIRAVGHEPLAIAAKHTPGTLLRQHLIECLRIIHDVGENKPVILNSDMYDPFLNAVERSNRSSYYPLVNGDFTGSWLPIRDSELPARPAVTIWNWSLANSDPNETKQLVKSSYTHFKGLSFPQVVGGFYDVDKSLAPAYSRKLFRMAKNNGGVITGVCYYTAERKLHHLEDFAKAADELWSQ